MAQVFLNDVDDAVAEVKWAKEHNLFGGILMPGYRPIVISEPLYSEVYDPLWAVCEELDTAGQ